MRIIRNSVHIKLVFQFHPCNLKEREFSVYTNNLSSLLSITCLVLLNHGTHFGVCRDVAIFLTTTPLAANLYNWMRKLSFKTSAVVI